MKKTFQKAELNVIRIKDDIIATSGELDFQEENLNGAWS